MKHRISSFYFLHFIIFSNVFIVTLTSKSSYLYSPNYSIFNTNFLKNNSSSFSIWTKEFLFTNIDSFFSDYSYFITTSKTGIISIIHNNQTLFSIDFNKKMYKTNFNQSNIIKGDNVILPMEGKLFRVKNLETENFEEFTTPIKDLVDMTPFSLWFSQDYYFIGNKKYYEVKLMKKENNSDFELDLNNIIFIDYTLICLSDNIQAWNTTITNVLFEDKSCGNNNKFITENILIYESNEVLEAVMKEIFLNKLNDIMFIHVYDIKNKKFIKLYDFNTYTHLIQNNTGDNNLEEKNINEFFNDDDNIINAFDYNNDLSYQYDIDFIIYYCIVSFIILCLIVLILNNCIYKNIFTLKDLYSKKHTSKLNNISDNKKSLLIKDEEKESDKGSFKFIYNYFKKNRINIGDELELKPFKSKEKKQKISMINDLRYIIQKDLKGIKKFKNSMSSENLLSKLNNNDDFIFQKKNVISRNSKILKELELTKIKQQSEINYQTRLEKDFKEITFLKKKVYKNEIVVILKAKHKIDEQLYTIKIKKLSNPIQEQSVIAEAQNMTKIRSKHIVEYITCWIDTSVGSFEYLFKDKNKNPEEINNDSEFFSSKNNSKVIDIFDNKFKDLILPEIKDDNYMNEYSKKNSLSEDECPTNIKNKINLDTKYYDKKEEDKNIINDKKKNKSDHIEDYSIEKNKSDNQRDISGLNVYFFIQMEFCQQITLDKYIKDHSFSKINNKIMYTFTYQLIKSLAKIHEKKIIHANINPKNIYVINENSIKIGDFSSAKEITLKTKRKPNKNDILHSSQSCQNILELSESNDIDEENIGETLYLSPEQELGLGLSKKSDIYSLGLVLYEMCECFKEQDIREVNINRLRKFKIFNEKFKEDYFFQYNLILQMIENDEEKRPSCEELLESKDLQSWKLCVEK